MSVQLQSPSTARCERTLQAALEAAAPFAWPFPHWVARRTFAPATAKALTRLPLGPPPAGLAWGTRDAHNAMRRYFDVPTIAEHAVCRHVAAAFQSSATARAIEAVTGAQLHGAWLRIEFAQDLDGFWLQPHTDLGVKRFTLLCCLAPSGQDLGADLYWPGGRPAKRVDFRPGVALAFVPSADSWHGFEPRPIRGVRKTLIVNYVSDTWRAREQLAFPSEPVRTAGAR